MKKVRKTIFIIIMVAALCVVGYCGWTIGSYYYNADHAKQQQQDLMNDIKKETQSTDSTASQDTASNDSQPFMPDSSTYSLLHDRNNDYLGWIHWDSGIVNVQLMQGEQYIDRNLYGYSQMGGSAFIDNGISLDSKNLPVYGHAVFSAFNTSMGNITFSALRDLSDQSTYERNSTFQIYWADHVSDYQVFAVDVIDVSQNKWSYMQNQFVNDKETQDWIDRAYKYSSIQSNVDVSPSDSFISLQTCTYYNSASRTIVFAKEVQKAAY